MHAFEKCKNGNHDTLGEIVFLLKCRRTGALFTRKFSDLKTYPGEDTREQYQSFEKELKKNLVHLYGLTVCCSKCGKPLTVDNPDYSSDRLILTRNRKTS